MRCLILVGFVLAIFGLSGSELPAQKVKNEIKEEPKIEPVKEPEIKWPDKLGGKTLDEWVSLARTSHDASTRDQAIRMLPYFGPVSRQAAGRLLIDIMNKDTDFNVSMTAVAMVPLIGFDTADVDAALTAMLKHLTSTTTANHTKFEVTTAIGNCGPIFSRAIPTIVKLPLKDEKSWQNRKAAATALGRIGQQMPAVPPMKDEDGPGPDPLAVRGLISVLLKDTSHQVRREAINALLLLGPPKIEAVWKELRAALEATWQKDHDKSVALWARVAYLRIDQEPLPKTNDPNLAAITKLLSSKDLEEKIDAIQALGVLGDQAVSRINDLIALVRSNDTRIVNVKVKKDKAKKDRLKDDQAKDDSEHNEAAGTIAMALWALSQMPSKFKQTEAVIAEYKNAQDPVIKGAADQAWKVLTKTDDKKNEPPAIK